jgi:hypothetical protein
MKIATIVCYIVATKGGQNEDHNRNIGSPALLDLNFNCICQMSDGVYAERVSYLLLLPWGVLLLLLRGVYELVHTLRHFGVHRCHVRSL